MASLSRRCSELQGEAEQLRPLAEGGGGYGGGADAEKEAMGRKAIQHLSQLVRDKEAEIEALRSRNGSLLQVLQGAEGGAAEVGGVKRLLAEKEAAEARLRAFHQDREQLVAALSQKHAESVGYHAEIQRLVALMQAERPKWMAAQEEAQTLRRELSEASAGKRVSEEALATLRVSYNELLVAQKASAELEASAPAANSEVISFPLRIILFLKRNSASWLCRPGRASWSERCGSSWSASPSSRAKRKSDRATSRPR